MLNIGSISNAASAAEYHTAKDSQLADPDYQGTMLEGALAERLGIVGEIDEEGLRALYEGEIPQLDSQIDPQINENPAAPEAGAGDGDHTSTADAVITEAGEGANASAEPGAAAVTQARQLQLDFDALQNSSAQTPESSDQAEQPGQGDKAADSPAVLLGSAQAEGHRAGDELIFSVPKSVSILGVTYGDTRLIDAAIAANRETMAYAQKHHAQARVTKNGHTQVERTDNLLWSRVSHGYDDAGLPHFHEHLGLINKTQRADGQLVALDNRAIWANSALLSSINKSILAEKVRGLGYAIERTGNGRGWDISAVPANVREANATRGDMIKDRLTILGKASPEANRIARYETRSFESKTSTPGERNARNREADQALGFDGDAVVAAAKAQTRAPDRVGLFAQLKQTVTQYYKNAIAQHDLRAEVSLANSPYLPSNIRELTQDKGLAMSAVALASAISHYEQREAGFKERDVLRHALDLQQPGVTIEKLDSVMQRHKDAGLIISGPPGKDGSLSPWITTRDALEVESSIIARIEAGQGNGAPYLDADAVGPALQPYLPDSADGPGGKRQLSDDQLRAAQAILANKDSLLLVQGYSGTGKTSLLEPVAAYIRDSGFEVIGLGPTTRAMQELEGAGIPSQTLASFLSQSQRALGGDAEAIVEGKARYGGTHIIVDEMSFVSNRDHEQLLATKELFGFRALTEVGDSYQLQAVDAGKSYELVQRLPVAQATLSEILRQKDENLKAFNLAIREGKVSEAFTAIRGNIIESDDYLRAAAGSYAALGEAARNETLLVTLGNKDRIAANAMVQSSLAEQGALRGEGTQHTIYENRGLTDAQLRDIHHYHKDDILRVGRDSPSTGLKRGDYMVTKVDGKTVHLTNTAGKYARLAPRDYQGGNVARADQNAPQEAIALIDKRSVTIHAGERVRWSAPDRSNRIANGNMATIEHISADGAIKFRLHDDRTVTLKPDDPQIRNFDLGYAVNAHKVQGASADKVIAAADGNERLLATLRTAYVNLTRPVNELELYTNSAAQLEVTIARSNSDKASAVEVAGEYPYSKAGSASDTIGQQGNADRTVPHNVDVRHASGVNMSATRMSILDDLEDHFKPGTNLADALNGHAVKAPDFAASVLEHFDDRTAAAAGRIDPEFASGVVEVEAVLKPEAVPPAQNIDSKVPEKELTRDFDMGM
jgi:conjugative relaxase-like TrwC/TraI family protein